MRTINITFPSIEAFEEAFNLHFKMGGAFVLGDWGVEVHDSCKALLIHPKHKDKLELSVRVVWVSNTGKHTGVGLQFEDFTPKLRQQIETFIHAEPVSLVAPAKGRGNKSKGLNLNERLRSLTPAKQRLMARDGSVQERTVLERIYGRSVWESLLRNPRLTLPEVARIARMGNLPIPLVELICSNTTWIRSGIVRRAILGNPRTPKKVIVQVFRVTPKREVALAAKQTAYPPLVREVARRIVGKS